jgi:uncharacterized protein YeaO (DUF488 family)
MKEIRTKRVYEPAGPDDGLRVLVDRLWPRGMTKDEVRAAMWLKDVAPSTMLRRWFGHDRSKWDTFRRRYLEELAACPAGLDVLREAAGRGRVTLLYAARDIECNHAAVLREYLLSRLDDRDAGA